MKREFLTGLGVDASVIDQIMAENGKDVEGLKAQLSVQKGLASSHSLSSPSQESAIKT